MSNTPTPADIEALAQQHLKAFAQFTGAGEVWFEGEVEFARAVLAKWGTPAPVGVEPIGYLYCGGADGDELEDWEIVADQHQCDKLNEHHGALGKEARLPIYTTPQPTQAQARGAVPLTDEQLAEMMRDTWGCASIAPRHALEFARAIERAHGITQKGGSNADA